MKELIYLQLDSQIPFHQSVDEDLWWTFEFLPVFSHFDILEGICGVAEDEL